MPLTITRAAAVTTALALLWVGLAVGARTAAASSVADVEVELTRLANHERTSRGLAPLRVDVRLVASARAWSERLAATGTVVHDPGLPKGLPAGVTAWAENVASTSAAGDVARGLHAAFMASAPHRANILDRRYTELGLGVAAGSGGTFVTQRFTAGAPARVAAAVEATAELAERHFGSQRAAHAVVVRDDVYADALAAGPLAGRSGPILLTPRGPALHPRVRLALERTVPRGGTVWITGGTAAVTAQAEHELQAAGWNVRRIAGADRVETAARVARAVTERDGRPDVALVATASGWADAAAGGAYGARTGSPVLLAQRDSVPAATRAALDAIRPRRVAALGGTAVLSEGVLARLGAERVSGASRQQTSVAIAALLWGHDRAGPAAWMGVPAYRDDAWTWALGAAPVAARRGAPVVLLGPELPASVRDYLAGLRYEQTPELLLHGPVPPATADEVRALLR